MVAHRLAKSRARVRLPYSALNIIKLKIEIMNVGLYDVSFVESKFGGYVGYLTDKPNVISQGETIDKLIDGLRDALAVMTIYEYKILN
jgi:hypothetical protein